MIALLCNAGPDVQGNPRKTTLFIDEYGYIHDARIGWPDLDEDDFTWGPIIRVSPDEHLFQVKLALGCGA
jgi:hypothetical protein